MTLKQTTLLMEFSMHSGIKRINSEYKTEEINFHNFKAEVKEKQLVAYFIIGREMNWRALEFRVNNFISNVCVQFHFVFFFSFF